MICLSLNPNAIELLKANPDKIDWEYVLENPNCFELLKDNYDKITNWRILSANPNAIEILKANPDKIDWSQLSANSNAIELLKTVQFFLLCRTFLDLYTLYIYYIQHNKSPY